MQCNVMLSVEG